MDFSRSQIAEALSWAVIEQVLDPIELGLRELGERSLFGEKAADQAVGVLDAASLAGTVGMSEVDSNAGGLTESFMSTELRAVIESERVSPAQAVEAPLELMADAVLSLGFEFSQDDESGFSVNQAQDVTALSVAHDQVAFTVAETRPGVDDRRALFDSDAMGYDRASGVLPVAEALFSLPVTFEQAVEVSAALFVPVDHRVDVLVADGLRRIDLGATGDLLRRPALPELPDDPGAGLRALSATALVGLPKPLVPPGLGIAGAPVGRGLGQPLSMHGRKLGQIFFHLLIQPAVSDSQPEEAILESDHVRVPFELARDRGLVLAHSAGDFRKAEPPAFEM